VKGDCGEVCVGLFSQVTVIEREGMASHCNKGGSGCKLGKIFFSGVVRQWHRLPREVVESQSLEVFKNHVDVALRFVGMVVMGCWLD